jgi:hypothetical protein
MAYPGGSNVMPRRRVEAIQLHVRTVGESLVVGIGKAVRLAIEESKR